MRLTRRRLLAGSATGAAALGALAVLPERVSPATKPMADDRERRLAERFAPELYFGAAERWYPTDPRRYASETDDGRTVVDGFDAFDGYARDITALGEPPEPIAFYQGRTYEGTDLGAIQFWFYSAFDQFSVNFHWHDWELLQVFFDLATDEPVLFCASAHSRQVPNNEFLDPGADRPAVISEVGSHSSALGVNARRDSFQRFPFDGGIADITNSVLDLVDIPAAYGLPRDEGFRLPYLVPELDGTPVHDLPELPNVTRDHLVPAELTVDSFVSDGEPPTDLPARRTGLHLRPENHPEADAADGTYALEHVANVSHIDAFTGPQLSFQFAVPGFLEDALGEHITTAGVPWDQPRFTDPAADVTDPIHRDALTERYDLDLTAALGDVVGVLREATGSSAAPGSNGIDTRRTRVEGVALLESDPVAVPTWCGVAAVRDVPAGEHRLTVNAAGLAPYAEELAHEGDGSRTRAGADGVVVTPPNADAVKLRARAASDGPAVSTVAVEDDFAGVVYAGRPPLDDDGSFGVYVHREGAFTAEVVDEDGSVGAFRVNPDAGQDTATVADLRTGKVALARFLDTLLSETLVQTTAVARGGIGAIDDPPTPDDTVERGGKAAAEAVERARSAVATMTNATDGDGVGDLDGADPSNETVDSGDVLTTAEDAGTDTLTTAEDLLSTDDWNATATSTDSDDGVLDDVAADPVGSAGSDPGPSGDWHGLALPPGGSGDGGEACERHGPHHDGIGHDGIGHDGIGHHGDGPDGNGRNGNGPDGNGRGRGTHGVPPGLLRALDAASAQAERAATAAENGNPETADRRLRGLRTRLSSILAAIERNAEDAPGNLPLLVEQRVAQADRRIDQALAASL